MANKFNPNLYNNDFFKKRGQLFKWETPLMEEFCQRYDIKSIIDFGCGLGQFLQGGLNVGCKEVKGYEIGYEAAKKYIPQSLQPFISYGDCTKLGDWGEFNLSMSIEVAEHIDPEKTDNFVQNLINSSNKLILITAAPPGQPGVGHINCQPKEFWINKFEEKDCVYLQEETQTTGRIWKSIGCQPYIPNNLMIFSIPT